MQSIGLAALAMAVATPAAANITSLSFTGSGVVQVIAGDGPAGVAIGDTVSGGGTITINAGAPQIADDFTGTYTFSKALIDSGDQGFSFALSGPTLSFNGGGGGNVYAEGRLEFLAGRLTDFYLMGDSDGYFTSVSSSAFLYDINNGQFTITGSFAVDPVSGAVPEPATWAMMLAGFGLAGNALRRRPKARAAGC